jgi:hypothetical protein
MLTTTLDVAARIIRVAEAVSDVPALSPLKPLCGVALVIIENAQVRYKHLYKCSFLRIFQAVHKLKDDHEELAARAAELVVAVLAESATSPPLSSETETHVKTLLVYVSFTPTMCNSLTRIMNKPSGRDTRLHGNASEIEMA